MRKNKKRRGMKIYDNFCGLSEDGEKEKCKMRLVRM